MATLKLNIDLRVNEGKSLYDYLLSLAEKSEVISIDEKFSEEELEVYYADLRKSAKDISEARKGKQKLISRKELFDGI